MESGALQIARYLRKVHFTKPWFRQNNPGTGFYNSLFIDEFFCKKLPWKLKEILCGSLPINGGDVRKNMKQCQESYRD